MTEIPEQAFILAAGRGERLRPYTDNVPKPMVNVGGETLIDRTLDKLVDAGVTHVTINLSYKAEILQKHLARRKAPYIYYSFEEEPLDTGGGVKNAIRMFGNKPFFVIAGDALWVDPPEENILKSLAKKWDDKNMDILTYMQPIERMRLTNGLGDYDLSEDGKVIRSHDKTGKYMWTNIRINHPRIFKDAPDGSFSFLELMDKAEAEGRFYALENPGDWHHISTPEDLERVNLHFLDSKIYA